MARHEQALRHLPEDEAVHPGTLLVASLDGSIALLRTSTGAAVWSASSQRELGTPAHDGARFYVARGSPLRLIRGRRRESPEQQLRRHERIQAEPAQLEARSVRDGHLLWRRADWGLIGHLDVGADAGGAVIVVASTSYYYGDRALHGLDSRTGATLWTYPTTSTYQVDGHRFALRAGRIFCFGEGGAGGMAVLDARSGRPLWQRDELQDLVFSPRGHVVVERRWLPGGMTLVHTLDAATGAVRQKRKLSGAMRAVSDGGVAYLSTSTYEEPGIAAVSLDDGRELWRADEVLSFQLAVTEATFYCAHVIVPDCVGEVEARDAHSGRRLWCWRTPGDLRALLRPWGTRTPRIAASAGLLVSKALTDALVQPSLRDIYFDVLRELQDGQWRHPHALHDAINAMWLAADTNAAYLGTRLGVFALRASDGYLLWHALGHSEC